ncbi:hypothetical protein [Butyrivibrio sp. MC2013]|nr:hypothetical protein [Butyrivibrio sp. MC2013]
MKAVVDILFLTIGGAGEIDDKLPPKWGQYNTFVKREKNNTVEFKM